MAPAKVEAEAGLRQQQEPAPDEAPELKSPKAGRVKLHASSQGLHDLSAH